MVDEEGRKEDKFEFDFTGESSGYISMPQARVLAITTARDEPGEYGSEYDGVSMFFEAAGDEEDEDYYHVRVSFRPIQNFTGAAGIEEFVIEKSGTIAIRQVVSAPNPSSGVSAEPGVQIAGGGNRSRILMLVGGGVLLVVIVAVAFFLLNSGDGPVPVSPAPVPAVTAPTAVAPAVAAPTVAPASTAPVPKPSAPAVAAPTAVTAAVAAPAAAPTTAPAAPVSKPSAPAVAAPTVAVPTPKPAAPAPFPAPAPAVVAAAVPAPAPAPASAVAAPTAAPAPATKLAPAAGGKNVYGRDMPADAAPMADQFLKMNYEREGEALEFAVSVYNSAAGGFQSGFSLALLSTDLSTVPGSATGWSSSDDMKTWTFYLAKDLKWSDGVPVTADDFVYTWQYYADPEHAYDFTWYFGMLEVENYGAVSMGQKPKEALGVEATDDYTLVFHLDTPAPYVPGFMMYGTPLAKHQAEKHGYYYSNDPATALSSNPWQLKEWIPNQHAEYEPNLNYTGKWLPYVENLKKVYGERKFDQYLAGEIDTVNGPFSPGDQEYLMGDSNLLKERGLSPGDFRTHYLFFDFQSEPFNDLKVRQAFAKAVDRESIMRYVVGEAAGEPRYGMLIPGFPDAAGPDLLKKYQGFDAAAAKQLMADAGFADGAGFPKLELALRSESEIGQAAAAAVAQSLKKHINVDVTINNMDGKSYMAELNGHNLTFAMVSYGFDYVDASNFMGVFKTDGRHNWNNKEFEDLRIEAGAMSLSPERSAKMIKLQEILSEDVGSLFFWSQIQNQLHKPYLKGPWRETNKAGWQGLQYPNWNTGFGAQNIYEVYISDNVSDFARSAY